MVPQILFSPKSCSARCSKRRIVRITRYSSSAVVRAMVMPASSWFEHHADRAVAPLGEHRPRLGEAGEREVMRREPLHVDEPAPEERERAPRDALRVRDRAEDVQMAAHDRGEIDAGALDPRPGRAAED